MSTHIDKQALRSRLLAGVDPDTRRLLAEHGFDAIPFVDFVERLRRSGFDPSLNHVGAELQPPAPECYLPLARPGSAAHAELVTTGQAAMDSGQVAVAVLNGGMATRFGKPVKGVAEALDGRSFLDLKLTQVGRAGAGRVPVLLMNSFATDAATREHLAGLDLGGLEVRCFTQLVSLRLTGEGELFRDDTGSVSPHAPGHGDFPYALAASGLLDELSARGVRYITLSNVDNLAASLDPAVLGAHIGAGRPITVELVPKRPQDPGGVPALVRGRVSIVEGFRLPPSFDLASVPTFSTNNYVFDLGALAQPGELDFFVVAKQVQGRTAVQFERLVNQLTETIDTTWLVVPRHGVESRFLPIKRPEDLRTQAAQLRAVLAGRGAVGPA